MVGLSIAQAHAALTAPGAPFELEDITVEQYGRTQHYKVWKNAPKTIRDIWAATLQFKDREYIVYEDERWTYAQCHRETSRYAHVLMNNLGVKKGDRVAILMRNYPQWLLSWWGISLTGAIITSCNSWLSVEEQVYCLTDVKAKIVLCDYERAEALMTMRDELKKGGVEHIVVARGDKAPAGCLLLNDFLKNAPADPAWPTVQIERDDDATILFTSGTTGKPKGAIAAQRTAGVNMINNFLVPVRDLLRKGEPIPTPDASIQKTTLMPVPLFHVTGSHAIMMPATIMGNKMVLMFKWDAGQALKLIEREKVSAMGGVPAMGWQLFEHPDFDKYDLSSIEGASFGGAPVPSQLGDRVKKSMPTILSGQGYGSTEASGVVTGNLGYDYVRKPTSIGVPAPGTEVKIVNPETGKEVAPGESGELWSRSGQTIKGYYNKKEATESTFTPEGWYKSGDIARMDEEGFFYIMDRVKDIVIRGGENITCIEVEDALYSHEAVMDCAVMGIPHRVLGEEVIAAVQIKEGHRGKVAAADLIKHVKAKLASFKVPIYIRLDNEPLPRNANGKILKREMKADLIKDALKSLGPRL
ncbi:hypothetical protein SmJEL517_g04694 [Synchytrium microbalum]|uniref:AMP-dependent synthetase/ligase domain-containing protein n=1 Tax=Synchytrium microbalum TaxID=1806994 RepID=A0A507BZ50_9FUNG|nr:uncharacterized protein SmJEL517_g04694 [Synchytrium microbalum]TPX32149.1 hypothetical protein SmJEL517_g04694 [Synchytrium microbalum]